MRGYQIHLIAHGHPQTPQSVQYLGRTDPSLSKAGREALMQLATRNIYPEVDCVYCGPLKRCLETAAILYPEERPFVDEDWTELDTGIFTGKPLEELQNNMYFKDWLKNGLAYEIPEGERGEDFLHRCLTAYANVFQNMSANGQHSAAVITHPGVIMCLLSAAGLPKLTVEQLLLSPGQGWTTIVSADMWMRSMAFEIYAPLPQPLED